MLLLLALAGCRAPVSLGVFRPPTTPSLSTAGDEIPRDLAISVELPTPAAVTGRTWSAGPRLEAVQLIGLESDLASETEGSLSLEQAIRLALEQNPDLVAMRAREPVARSAIRVAETYPWNPQFQTKVLPYNRDRAGADGAVSQEHVLVQTFELGGQRQFRIRAAMANRRQVINTIRQAALIGVAETTRLFFAVHYRRALRDMAQTLADLNQQLFGVMQRRHAAGQARMADVELARLQAQSSRRQQRLEDVRYLTAVMNLRKQLNVGAETRLELAGQWADWRWRSLDDVIGVPLTGSQAASADGKQRRMPSGGVALPPPDDGGALRQLIAGRPDVMAARAAMSMAAENLQLANAQRRPNVQMGPMWVRDEASTEFWGIQAQMDIPVVNTGMPLVEQRAAEVRQRQIATTQLENRAVLEARTAVWRYERARRLVAQSRNELTRAIPSIPDALKPFEDQFKAGQITLLEVLAARTAIVQSRQSYLDLLNELAQAAADVTQTTGLPPQQLIVEFEPLPIPLEEDSAP